MRLLFSKSAASEYAVLKEDAPEIAVKVKTILKDTILHPDFGIGNPIKLEGAYAGLWQRMYASGQVIVYSFNDDSVTVVSIGAREQALKRIHLEPYSDQEEHSVMNQMEANRLI